VLITQLHHIISSRNIIRYFMAVLIR